MSLIPGAIASVTQLTDGAAGSGGNTPLYLPYGSKYVQLQVSGDTTVVTNDGTYYIEVTTAGTNRTVTLPAAADNDQRVLIIKKVDSGTGYVIIDGNGSETIDGSTVYHVQAQYQEIQIISDGANWKVIGGDVSEYAYNTSNSDANDTTSFGNGASGQLLGVTVSANRFKRVRFLRAMQPGESVSFQISTNGSAWYDCIGASMPNNTNDMTCLMSLGGTFYGIGVFTRVNTTDFDILISKSRTASSGTYGADGADWSAYNGSLYWRVKKARG